MPSLFQMAAQQMSAQIAPGIDKAAQQAAENGQMSGSFAKQLSGMIQERAPAVIESGLKSMMGGGGKAVVNVMTDLLFSGSPETKAIGGLVKSAAGAYLDAASGLMSSESVGEALMGSIDPGTGKVSEQGMLNLVGHALDALDLEGAMSQMVESGMKAAASVTSSMMQDVASETLSVFGGEEEGNAQGEGQDVSW